MKREFRSIAAKSTHVAAVVMIASFVTGSAEACTRALYVGENGLVITGRSMDWGEDMYSNAWVFPRVWNATVRLARGASSGGRSMAASPYRVTRRVPPTA